MARFETLPVRASDALRDGPAFNERLYDHLNATPWWLASMGIHVLVALIASAIVRGSPVAAAPQRLSIVATSEPLLPLDPEIPPPDPIETPPLDQVDVPDVPDLENPVEDDPETDTEDPFQETAGDPDMNSDVDWDLPHDNSVMGVGPGGGGLFGRRGRGGDDNLGGDGNGRQFDGAAMAGLRWLKNHQSPAGAWDCDGFEAECRKNRCGGAGKPLYDTGITGLSLLAFLGAGETHRTPDYGHVVRRGLRHLKGSQDAEGCFGPRTGRHFTYNHALGALAMAEAWGVTHSPLFRSSAQNGIDFVMKCQNPYLAWRYGVKPQDNDTSVTGWMVMALKSGAAAGLRVDPDSFRGALNWLDKVTEPEYGRAGYTARGNGPSRPQELMDRFPTDKSESLTAVAVVTRIFCGAKRDDEWVRKGADLCLRSLPVWDEAAGSVDHYYWYYGTMAMFQVGGRHWTTWSDAMVPAIVKTQHRDGSDDRDGSWDPAGPWGPDGGRVYSTAINVLNMEIRDRYARVFGTR